MLQLLRLLGCGLMRMPSLTKLCARSTSCSASELPSGTNGLTN